MLSVILYGRNDSHGYNLHKRAAISLNAIAEVLTDPDDEIIFVDYNTPDELPTFPEAIQDTLTPRCRELLRTIRVRPSYHQQFAGKTRLVALEPQSRNIATRRTNPANRWILSTNTDMIFCPRKHPFSLTQALADLSDGFYHLPRFEVPEGFWERLDRLDARGAIQAMEANGPRFHLNEVVYGAYDNIYEAPGDFQLFLRQDLFDIQGFDERMILGWHADSNIARRMRLLRGEVKTALDEVWGFHCGHTRQATSLHGGNRTENDSNMFVASVDVAGVESQAQTWGAPNVEMEEIRLTTEDRYFPALRKVIGSAGPDITEATYNDSSFSEVSFTSEHVLPHLCDLVFNLPPGAPTLYFGADHTLLNGLATFLAEAGREPDIMVPGLPDLVSGIADSAPLAKVLPLAEAMQRAELIIIQYPSSDLASASDRDRQQWLCQRMLFDLAERYAGSAPRRVVTVNGIHNGLTQPLDYLLQPTVMPFSTRIRQGFVGASAAAAASTWGPDQPIYQKLSRFLPFSNFDRQMVSTVIDSLSAGEPVAGWQRLAPEIAAIASAPASARKSFAVSDEAAGRLLSEASSAMQDELSKLAEPAFDVGPRLHISNRLCSGADWDSPEWLRTAAAFFNLDALDFRGRTRWMWEHVALAIAARRLMPADPLGGGAAPKILLLAEVPDPLAAVLAHMGYQVRYVTADDLLARRPPGDWTSILENSSLTFPETWKPFLFDEAIDFDAFVSPLPCLFERSAEEVDAILSAVHGKMKPGALFLITAPVQINEVAYNGALGLAEWKVLYEPEGPLGIRGFTPVGEIDDRIPLDSAVRYAFEDRPEGTMRGLSYGYFASRITSALLAATWPQTLSAGSPDRIIWTPRPEGAWKVQTPYGTGELMVTRAADPGRRGGLLDRAEQVIETAAVAPTKESRNVLPRTTTTCKIRRTPTFMTIDAQAPTEDLGPWLAVCLNAGDAASVVIEIDASEEISDVASVIHGLGQGPAEISGGRIVILPRDGLLGRVGLAVRFAGASVTINELRVRIGAVSEADQMNEA